MSELRSYAQTLHLRAAHPPVEDEPGAEDPREEAAHDPDDERDGEALHRPGTVLGEDQARDEDRDVAVEDRRERLVVPGLHRRADAPPAPELFADALVDEHV